MKIVAHVGVKDESALIRRCLRHLARIGVERTVVFDYASTDGTADVVDELIRNGWPTALQRVAVPAGLEVEALRRLHVEAARAEQADWLILQDADEFWLPASGRIGDVASAVDAATAVIEVPRFNVPLTQAGAAAAPLMSPQHYADILLITRPITDFWQQRERYAEVPWMFSSVMPKIMLRPQRVVSLGNGGHSAQFEGGQPAGVHRPRDLLVAHLPFTTLARFIGKSNNVRDMLSTDAKRAALEGAYHWKEWIGRGADADMLEVARQEFRKSMLDARTLALLRHAGVIESAADWLAAGAGPPPR